jgi:hypothetical protein
MRNSFVTSLAILAMLAGAASASLQGELGFVGSFTPNSTPLSTATALTFDTASIVAGTGSYSGITTGPLPFTGFTFSPSLSPNPTTLWAKDGFSFEMTSVSIDLQTDDYLLLSGAGMLKGTGFTDTPGSFNFSGNTMGALFTFSAGNANIPEPTSLLVWGGLIAVGLMVKRRSLS